nr:uncharacterized protein LOC101412584 [Dasypus novemcinctus]
MSRRRGRGPGAEGRLRRPPGAVSICRPQGPGSLRPCGRRVALGGSGAGGCPQPASPAPAQGRCRPAPWGRCRGAPAAHAAPAPGRTRCPPLRPRTRRLPGVPRRQDVAQRRADPAGGRGHAADGPAADGVRCLLSLSIRCVFFCDCFYPYQWHRESVSLLLHQLSVCVPPFLGRLHFLSRWVALLTGCTPCTWALLRRGNHCVARHSLHTSALRMSQLHTGQGGPGFEPQTSHVVGILYGTFFYLNSSFCGNWWETQDPRREIMSLQDLKQKKTPAPLHTGSGRLARGGSLLMMATDPRHCPVLVNDEWP